MSSGQLTGGQKKVLLLVFFFPIFFMQKTKGTENYLGKENYRKNWGVKTTTLLLSLSS